MTFALSWELYAPGLGGWTVQRDSEEDGSDILLVDPPLVYGDGFAVQRDLIGIQITSSLGVHRAATLRDALLLICPLPPDVLAEVDRLAEMPAPSLG